MTPEQLKSSILQYAIQGKLVEQRAEEGTGEELYKKIQAEKQRLLKEGKIKKEKILPEISEDEVPFDIPESWKWCYIGDIFLHNTGKAQNSSGHTNGVKRKFITTSNLYWGRFEFAKVKEMYFTDKEAERCSAKKGDLLVCEGGDYGRSAVWTYDEEVCIQNHVHRLRPYCQIDVYFFYYIFYFYKNNGRIIGKGVGIKGLSSEAIHKIIVPLPPLTEQKRIVNKIGELLPYVDRYALSYEKLEKLNAGFPDDIKKSILQYAMQGKLVEQRAEEGTGEELYKKIQAEKQRLIKEGKIKKEKVLPEINDDEIPFDIPDSWKWTRWGELSFSIQYGYNAPAKINGRIKMVRITDIQNGVINWDKVPFCDIDDKDIDKYKLAENDILFARTGGTVGKTYIVRGILEESIYAGYLIRTRYSNMLNPLYLYYFMQTNLYWNQLRAGTISTAQPNCNGQTLSKMLIPLPPIIEQQRIVSRIEELLKYINTTRYTIVK